MTREEIYRTWAPDGAAWSRWAKPVLFAHLPEVSAVLEPSLLGTGLPELNLSWIPEADGTIAIVVDLPGARSVFFGLALAERGYRPIPLYNSVPTATRWGAGGLVVVDMSEVVAAVSSGAAPLMERRLPLDAPPAFLLDARRREGAGRHALVPSAFDNRSVSLPTDFPSANFLLASGVRRIVLVYENLSGSLPNTDLSHTLRRWQDAGIEIVAPDDASRLAPITIRKPRWFGYLWYGLMARAGLRRNALGGYGGLIPEPSSSRGSSFG
jgi:hypothetical protein